jgi:hypothetical protein
MSRAWTFIAETPYSANEQRGQCLGVLVRASKVFRCLELAFTPLAWAKQGTPFDFDPIIAKAPMQARPDHKFLARQPGPGAQVSQRCGTAFLQPAEPTAFAASSRANRQYAGG